MNREQASEVGVRRTALLLHTLAPSDREFMLARFESDQRAALNCLLEDLNSLGIPRHRTLLEETLSAVAASRLSGSPENLTAVLQTSSAADIARALESESPELIARLLQCAAWRWSEELLENLEPLRRRQVQSCLHDVKQVSPRLKEAVIRAVHTAWAAVAAETSVGPARIRCRQGLLLRLRNLVGLRK